jgi:hypothetical protein
VDPNDAHVVEQDQQSDNDNQSADHDAASTGPVPPALYPIVDAVHLALDPLVNVIVNVHDLA